MTRWHAQPGFTRVSSVLSNDEGVCGWRRRSRAGLPTYLPQRVSGSQKHSLPTCLGAWWLSHSGTSAHRQPPR
eukprot:5101674-Prymnesium_polylepis.1